MARFQAGDDQDAFELMNRLWRPMILPGKDANSTVWENLTLDGQPGLGPNTSLAHGWAAMPAVALSSQVLGIQPTTAGYSTWAIRPHPGSLAWAEGSAPTPAGEINVRWDHTPAQFKLHISAPRGTLGQVALPTFGNIVQVTVNGKVVWDGNAAHGLKAHKDGAYLLLDQLPSGAYDIRTRFERNARH